MGSTMGDFIMNCGTVTKWNIIYLLFPVDVYGESLMISQSDVKEGKGHLVHRLYSVFSSF